MSNVNIKRVVENIRSGTTVYTPLVECIVNAIQAVEAANIDQGKVEIAVERVGQKELDGGLASVESFTITDNGIGFTKKNRDSFDTLYSDAKIEQGGKGFGRFTCLKYFDDMIVESVFADDEGQQKRSFRMGRQTDIIVRETISASPDGVLGSKVKLSKVKGNRFSDKKLTTIARALVERLLPYFIDAAYTCPKITISENDSTGQIVLNDFVNNELSALIKEVPLAQNSFSLGESDSTQTFTVRIFKIYSPKNQRSKISLVADRREVTDNVIHTYVPEFIDEFYDESDDNDGGIGKNYIVKAYVFGPYLDANVSLERGGFDFPKTDDLLHSVSQSEIEEATANMARDALGSTVTARQEKKKQHVQDYVEETAPWHRTILEDIDLTAMPYNPTAEQIETVFQKEKFSQEVAIRKKVGQMLADNGADNFSDGLTEIVNQISKTSKNDLIHYIALRKNVLDFFGKSLEADEDGKYPSEGAVHDIIFPRKGDSKTTSFEDHNLWILDERLNFTNFVNSDKPLGGGSSERPDLLVYDNPVLFRGDNEASNPITIFEFKKPQRDDFVNQSSKEDPVQQIIRYVNNIKKGKFQTPKGRDISVAENTPFYGYVVCDINKKVEVWLETEKDFTPMPDRRGWFKWIGNINLYVEVLSWDKVQRDASMRNRVFFNTLGIE